MNRKIVAGNWKMNLDRQEAQLLSSEIAGMMQDEVPASAQVILFPPFPYLGMISKQLENDKRIFIGAQNCSEHESGAYTGEVSAKMIRSCGASHVLVGHSERRSYFQESDAVLSKKINIALKNNLRPVFCCGESLNQRNSNSHFDIIQSQLENGLFHLSENEMNRCVIAYEPVWAIGTGMTASPAQAQEMHEFIRKTVAVKYNFSVASALTILYGGSCNEKNASELFALPDVDGGLIGGASLKSRSFITIVKALSEQQ